VMNRHPLSSRFTSTATKQVTTNADVQAAIECRDVPG